MRKHRKHLGRLHSPANQIVIFVADPPSFRHKDDNSATKFDNLHQAVSVLRDDGGSRLRYLHVCIIPVKMAEEFFSSLWRIRERTVVPISTRAVSSKRWLRTSVEITESPCAGLRR